MESSHETIHKISYNPGTWNLLRLETYVISKSMGIIKIETGSNAVARKIPQTLCIFGSNLLATLFQRIPRRNIGQHSI